jgi:PBP1b-binding outer membrane lipoprotein LpoB
MKKLTFIFLASMALAGCASIREWTLPTEGEVKKTPAVLSSCIENAFSEHRATHNTKLKQRLTQSASGEFIWDQLDVANVILHRVVIAQGSEASTSRYRVDAISAVGLYGLGKIDSCFK